MVSYLIGGKCLKGVEYTDPSDTLNQSSFSFSSSASSSLSDFSFNANQIGFRSTYYNYSDGGAILLRRHGLSSQDLSDRLLQVSQEETWLELDASRNQISTLPSRLQLFTGLTQLILTNNAISIIPPEIYRNLGRLQTLMLSENQIEFIPQDMPQYLPMLATLCLDSNQIKSLPDSISYWVNMRELRLGSEFGGNLLTILPDTIADMTRLMDLDVSFNLIDTLLPDTFFNLPSLKSINLSHNAITELPNDVLFGSCNKLTTIDLSDNQINSIPQVLATDIMRLRSLELLNLSNNQLCIIPSDLLDQASTQIIIKGNPVTYFSLQQQQQREQVQDDENNNAYNQIVRSMLQRAELTEDYPATSSHDTFDMDAFRDDGLYNNNRYHQHNISEILTEQARVHHIIRDNSASRAAITGVVIETPPPVIQQTEEPAESNDSSSSLLDVHDEESNMNTTFLIHSLREISLRTIITISKKKDVSIISLIPEHIAHDLKTDKIQQCNYCQQPYVREWLSSVQLKSYRGHSSVVRKVRFCGTKCWRDYRERRNQQALSAQNNILNPSQQQQEAREYVQQHEHALEPGSIDWIMAAVSAATAQEEQLDSLANAIF